MSALERKLREVLDAHPQVEIAVMFGSRARNTARDHSDVDLAIRGSADVIELTAHLERAVGHAVDLVDIDTAPPHLRFEIARDGVLLVERRPHAWADIRARAMVDWWDWAPTARRIQRAVARRLRERVILGSP